MQTPTTRDIETAQPTAGTVRAWWLGGTGFVLKTARGTQIHIDPYFSNCVARIFGIERAFPPPVPVTLAEPDLVIATHWHEDHLDPEGLPALAARTNTRFLCPPSCRSRLMGWGIAGDRIATLEPGDTHTFRDARIAATPARHVAGIPGWEAPDAIGLLIDIDGVRMYHTGDTEYDLRLRALGESLAPPIDVMMAVINGTGGNMNAHEAALLAWHLHPRVLIPMHHVLWKDFTGGAQATLDPQLLTSTYRALGGTARVCALSVGEGMDLASTKKAT